ncbi:MAG TPA: phage major capsid protein [Acidimicrobiia bacterium]|nr:phage major capsid protein [Acidimicrobiia bacterium]
MTKVTSPTTPEELGEALRDKDRLKNLFEEGKFGEFINGYIENVAKKDKDLAAQVNEQVQIGIAEFMKANGGTAKALNHDPKATPSGAPSRLYNNPRAAGAPLDGLFPDFYTYLQAVWHKGNKDKETQEKIEKIRNYSERVPAEGGLLVPEEFRSQLMQLALESSVVRPRATVIPMANPRLHVPMVDETSHATSIFGGVIVYRTEEGAELTESAASFASVKLDVTKQTALSHVPNELVRDWGAFGAFMDSTLPAAISWFEDVDYISGNGTGAPLGALNSGNTAIVSCAKESGQAATTIVWENVLHMYQRMLPSSLGRAVWVAAPNTFFELATMALSVGTGGSAVWIVDATGAPVLTLLGRPVILTEKAPATLGTKGDLSFVDFGMYLIGDYQTMSVDSSEHVKFTSDKTTFRVIARNDGRPWLQSALTPKYGGETLSAFIQLDTRA